MSLILDMATQLRTCRHDNDYGRRFHPLLSQQKEDRILEKGRKSKNGRHWSASRKITRQRQSKFSISDIPLAIFLFSQTWALPILMLSQTDEDKANFAKMIDVIKGSKKGKTLGVFSKENYPGAFMDAWRAAVNAESFETVSLILY